jgi:hypothetical protein
MKWWIARWAAVLVLAVGIIAAILLRVLISLHCPPPGLVGTCSRTEDPRIRLRFAIAIALALPLAIALGGRRFRRWMVVVATVVVCSGIALAVAPLSMTTRLVPPRDRVLPSALNQQPPSPGALAAGDAMDSASATTRLVDSDPDKP